MSVDLKKCVRYVGGEPAVTFEKGDAPGHEFHGNQYSTGGGSNAKNYASGAERARKETAASEKKFPKGTIVRANYQGAPNEEVIGHEGNMLITTRPGKPIGYLHSTKAVHVK